MMLFVQYKQDLVQSFYDVAEKSVYLVSFLIYSFGPFLPFVKYDSFLSLG